MAQNTFYGEGYQEQVYERVNQRIHEMLPRLTTLNNRQLALGKERKESRKRHFDEKHPDLKKKEVTAKKPSRKARTTKKKNEDEEEKEQQKVPTPATAETASTPSDQGEKKAIKGEEEGGSSLVQNSSQFSEQGQSGVVTVETSGETHKSNVDDVAAFLMNGAEKEVEVDGWDDFIVCFQSFLIAQLGCRRVR